MKLKNLVGERFKERPSDCVIDSHALMLRGGYMKYVANGIFSSYMPLKRILRKIEQIIREEMDAIDGQEVLFPVVMPAALWEESGRYDSIGSELLRFTDRNNTRMVLGMTHEEAAVQLVRDYAKSYTRYPFMIYQIQTKFRDEARPRGGLIRVREFTMKDAYSFHTSREDLEAYYARCHQAYENIYRRCGIPEVISVASDSGMMGGSLSHEFMLLTPVGEDSIAICKECGYKSNIEAAECITNLSSEAAAEADNAGTQQDNAGGATDSSGSLPLTEVHTPGAHTIDEVCGVLGIPAQSLCKAVVYQRITCSADQEPAKDGDGASATAEGQDGGYVVLFIRGDLEANETKLTNYLGCDIRPAAITEDSGLAAGFIGPVGLTTNVTVLYDRSLEGVENLCCGANREDFHCTGLSMSRDVSGAVYHDFAKIIEGGICPCCHKNTITISRGIEVGNIFQLGTKYTKSMNMQYLDSEGSAHYPIMGCYGIGVGRLAASVCEARHDDYGPVWPMAIAPWQVHLCCMRADNAETKACADKLYAELQAAGAEVLYDDRSDVSAGVMFSDADLLGIPLRVIVSPRNLKESCCEISARDKSFSYKEPLESAVAKILSEIGKALKN